LAILNVVEFVFSIIQSESVGFGGLTVYNGRSFIKGQAVADLGERAPLILGEKKKK